MKRENYKEFSRMIIPLVGGKENVVRVLNCMTRLRFVLKDESLLKEEEIKELSDVKGVVRRGGQVQIVIGTEVSELAPIVRKDLGIAEEDNSDTVQKAEDEKVKENAFNKLFKIITGCVVPLIPVLIGSGLIKGLMVILQTAGVIQIPSDEFTILLAISNASMYFLPVLLGFTSAKVFKMNEFVGATIGAAIMYPTLVQLATDGATMKFFGIPITIENYSQSFLPVILAVFVASYLERGLKKILPQVLHAMLVPTIVLLVTVPVTLVVLGPIMTACSEGISNVLFAIYDFNPIVCGVLLGGFWQLIVLLGFHSLVLPVLTNNLVTMGSDPINAILGVTVWALAGLALGYALSTKDKNERSMGFANLISCFCGITEPTIYTIALPNFKLFSAAWIGGGIGGGILGGLGARLYTLSGDGILRIPGMINPEGLDVSFYGFIGCALLAMVITCILTMIMMKVFGINGAKTTQKEISEKEATKKAEVVEIASPLEGKLIELSKVSDQSIANGDLGEGIAIIPDKGEVVAPVDGEISMLFETKHAIGITAENGVEILIHIGMDTVNLNGKYFDAVKSTGDKIKKD